MSAFLRSAFTAIDDYRADLGETPVWCQRTQSLLWVDILNMKLLRYWPSQQKTETRKLPTLTSAVLLTESMNRFCWSHRTGYIFTITPSAKQKNCVITSVQMAPVPMKPPSRRTVRCGLVRWTSKKRRRSARGIAMKWAMKNLC